MERCLGSGFNLCWRTHVVVAVLLLGSVPAALTQSGFLNIDCGATSKYIDSATGLSWEPDVPYISSGKTQTLTLPSSLQSFTEMQTLRYFDDSRAKNCYALPVTSSGIYLLKLSFFYGNYDNANLPPKFQVAIDANIISNVSVDTTGVSHQEYHYKSQGNVTYVCLMRTSPGATPFISGISLKEASLLAFGYVKQFNTSLQEGIIMTTWNRLNFGGMALIRAPADYYDRLWFPATFYYLTRNVANYEFLTTTTPIQTLVGAKSFPPSAVMQSAVTSLGLRTLESFLLPEGSPSIDSNSVYFALYFTELNSSASGPPLRNFTIQTPDLSTYAPVIDMSGFKFLGYGSWHFFLNGVSVVKSTTVVLTPLASAVAGPILNCMEIFARSEARKAKTAERDVVASPVASWSFSRGSHPCWTGISTYYMTNKNFGMVYQPTGRLKLPLAIEDIKKSLNLTEWTGDPCLPSPHAWITCSIPDPTSNAPAPAISSVNLSGYQLVGTLQASFANLWDLTSLDLSNNDLSGPLPEWLTTMTALRLLAVQNNNFSGPIPEGLLSANSQIRFTYSGNPFLGPPPAPGPASKCSNCGKSNIAVIAGASAGGVVGLALITVIAILLCRRWKRKRKLSDEERRAPKRLVTPGGAKAYTFAEVTAATAQFKRELGKGGFGPVYYGKLPDGQEVAVKVADGNSKHEERAFFNEVDVLSRVRHKNLVALVGYCQEQKQILIYEYMRNGSLFDHLHGRSESTGTLNWRTRLRIALNAAQGLDYLHTACSPSFVHRDVKSSNILLTPRFEAKVADFGLTKLMGEAEDSGVITTNVMGTAGYLDPEYHSTHYISSKSDVYSFGIVLLELLTGSLPIDHSGPRERNPNLANWVRENLQSNNITLILDPVVTSSNPNMEAVWKVAEVAMRSVEPKGVHRPTMSEVVQELQGALAIEATNVPSTRAPTLHSSLLQGFSDYSSGAHGPTSLPTPR